MIDDILMIIAKLLLLGLGVLGLFVVGILIMIMYKITVELSKK